MKVKEQHKKDAGGMTLIELVASALIISIILVGVMAVGTTVKTAQESTQKSSILSARMMTAMSFLTKDASLAIGDAARPGIVTFFSGAHQRQICFRHDVNNPGSYADDDWVCYLHGSSLDIHRIILDTLVWPPARYLWDDCIASSCSNWHMLQISAPGFFNVVVDADGKIQYVDITLTARYDRTKAVDPMTNPELTLTTRVNPTLHTR